MGDGDGGVGDGERMRGGYGRQGRGRLEMGVPQQLGTGFGGCGENTQGPCCVGVG